jgi:hypothetical protein
LPLEKRRGFFANAQNDKKELMRFFADAQNDTFFVTLRRMPKGLLLFCHSEGLNAPRNLSEEKEEILRNFVPQNDKKGVRMTE